MCSTGAMIGMSLASTAGGLYSQNQQAQAQADANQRQYDQTMNTYRANNEQVNLQGQQTREQSIQQQNNNNIEAAKAQGKATNAAGATGADGNSVTALLGDLSGQQARYNDSVNTNYESSIAALENQRQNVHAQAASTINGLQTPTMPDYMTAGLRISDAGYKYYS
jgi:hypothetical protein